MLLSFENLIQIELESFIFVLQTKCGGLDTLCLPTYVVSPNIKLLYLSSTQVVSMSLGYNSCLVSMNGGYVIGFPYCTQSDCTYYAIYLLLLLCGLVRSQSKKGFTLLISEPFNYALAHLMGFLHSLITFCLYLGLPK